MVSAVPADLGLVRKYDSTTVLNGVDVEVRERDSPTVLGPSGSGRSAVAVLAVLTGGTTAMGVYGSYQLDRTAGATINASGAIELVACLVIGALAVFAALSGSRPLPRIVTRRPRRDRRPTTDGAPVRTPRKA